MSKSSSFSVLPIGFSERERKLFGSIASLTRGRTRTYGLADDLSGHADIFVVNGDDPNALRTWQERRAAIGEQPSLVVSQSPIEQAGVVHIRRPLIFTRVVTALDQVATQSLKFAPDLVIEQGATLSTELKGTINRMSGIAEKPLKHRALVVDDSSSVRKLMEIELRISGVAGDFAESAGEAWKLLSQKRYDIIFLDVILPDVDGYQICKAIKKSKSTKQTPVVMLTGRSSPFDRVRGKLSGCNSYLVKPVPHEALQKVFRRYLPTEENGTEQLALGAATPHIANG